MWLYLALTLPLIPVLIIPWFIADSPRRESALVTLSVVALYGWMAALHNWITVRPGEIEIGYFSIYRRTIPLREIEHAQQVHVHPFRQFGGAGIKGLAKSKQGLLLGGNVRPGLRFETFDHRTYTCTFPDVEPIIAALARQGLILSPDIADNAPGRV